jgi:hypothetical protein
MEFSMKFKVAALTLALVLAGCSSTKPSYEVEPGPVTAINAQKLATSFKRQGIKLEWNCWWGTGFSEATCVKSDIKAIEVTSYANSFGNSEVMRERAFVAAEMQAKAKLIHFINEGVSSTNVMQTVTKNVEKAKDQITSKIKSDDVVSMSDDEAAKGSNLAVRENSNETVRTLTESIRNNAEGKIRGAYVRDAEIVDRQTVMVTIRWDKDSQEAARNLRKNFK